MATPKLDSVTLINPSVLKNHIANISFYGEDVPVWLKESIQQHGIRDPLRVCRSNDPSMDGVVVAGRRRRIAAMELGIKQVPVQFWQCDDPLELEREVFLLNVRSDITTEQRLRIFTRLVEIESMLASARMKAGVKIGPETALPHPESNGRASNGEAPKKTARPTKAGTAVDLAASQAGLKPTNARKGAAVVKAADTLKAEGKTEAAAEVLDTLNTKSIGAAERKLQEVAPSSSLADSAETREVTKHLRALAGGITRAEEGMKEGIKALDIWRRSPAGTSVRTFHKLEGLLRTFCDMLEGPLNKSKEITKDWDAALAELKDKS